MVHIIYQIYQTIATRVIYRTNLEAPAKGESVEMFEVLVVGRLVSYFAEARSAYENRCPDRDLVDRADRVAARLRNRLMVGKRYGGPQSPTPGPARPRWSSRQLRPRSGAVVLLPIAAAPLLVAGFGEIIAGNPIAALIEFGAFALIAAGARIVAQGIAAALAFDARTTAKPPAAPRKIIGSVAVGLGVALASAFAWPLGLVSGGLMGALAAGALLFAVGLDPMRAKGIADGGIQAKRASEAIEQAQALLDAIHLEAEKTRDRPLQGQVERFSASVFEVMQTVEGDPRDLPAARRYLGLYLKGARDATRSYAELTRNRSDDAARSQYLSLISDLEAQFRAKRETLLEDNRSALDIEIDVLRHRLAQDGVTPDKEDPLNA